MEKHKLPGSVLFVCYLNSIRSPMAEGLMKKHYGSHVYVQSCGLAEGDLDDLMVAVMREANVDMSTHKSRTLAQLQDALFDVVIAFTEDAGRAVNAVFGDSDTVVEVWPTPDPTSGALDVRAMMDNYRSIRSNIENRLLNRFGEPVGARDSA